MYEGHLEIRRKGSEVERYQDAFSLVHTEVRLIRAERQLQEDDAMAAESKDLTVKDEPCKVTVDSPNHTSWTVEVEQSGANGAVTRYVREQDQVTLQQGTQEPEGILPNADGIAVLGELHEYLFEFKDSGL